MRCYFLELVNKVLGWCPHDVVDLVNLVELILTRKEWEQGQNFEEDATDTPNVHLVAVMAVGHETFRRAIPARRDVLRKRGLVKQTSTTAQVCEFYRLSRQQNIFPNS